MSGKHLITIPRITIRRFLEEFKLAVQAEAVNSFWDSRAKGVLKKRPEKLGQELLGVFASAKLAGRGAAIREGTSGIGFVDVQVTFSSGLLHVVELKMLKGERLPGATQLATYMAHKKRKEGWLLLLDVRKWGQKKPVPATILRPSGIIRTVQIELNPVPPSKLP